MKPLPASTLRSPAPFALAAALALLAACNRNEPAPQNAPPPAASAASSASAAASGPLIPPMAASAPTDAQRSAGQQIATQGGGGAVAACSGCHGAQGEGNAAAGFPRIAGQGHAYLLHQLQSYADGSRASDVMAPIAKAMSDEQRTNAAAYYASLAPAGAASAASAPAAPATPASGTAQRGLRLASVGDEQLAVQACANCHGPGGTGEGSHYPYLAGQHAAYLVQQLGAWRSGARHNDPTGQMPGIAKSLNDADAQAAAAYYAQQPPPAQALDASASPAPPATAASAIVSGPRGGGGGAPPQGIGTSQGTSTTGGSQGIGGGGAATGAGAQGSKTGEAAVPAASGASR